MAAKRCGLPAHTYKNIRNLDVTGGYLRHATLPHCDALFFDVVSALGGTRTAHEASIADLQEDLRLALGGHDAPPPRDDDADHEVWEVVDEVGADDGGARSTDGLQDVYVGEALRDQGVQTAECEGVVELHHDGYDTDSAVGFPAMTGASYVATGAERFDEEHGGDGGDECSEGGCAGPLPLATTNGHGRKTAPHEHYAELFALLELASRRRGAARRPRRRRSSPPRGRARAHSAGRLNHRQTVIVLERLAKIDASVSGASAGAGLLQRIRDLEEKLDTMC